MPQPQVLRPNARGDAIGGPDVLRQPDAALVQWQHPAGVGEFEAAIAGSQWQQVHRRLADEVGDEHVRWPLIKVVRCCDLLQHAVVHHRNPIRHRRRFGLVMRDQDRGHGAELLQPLDFRPQVDLLVTIQMRQRLVEEDELRIAHQRPADRCPLLSAARQHFDVPVGERVQRKQIEHLVDASLDLSGGQMTDREGK